MKRFFYCFAIALASFTISSAQAEKKSEKISADEIIEKHRASVGTADALSAIRSRVMVGVGVHTAKSTPGKIGGAAQLAMSGDKFLLAILLNSNDYPYEKIGYDGKDVTTGALPGGGTSPIGDFLRNNKLILKRGLLGGVLSGGWPLLSSGKDVKFSSAGIVKTGDRSLYKLKVNAAGIGDMTVSLYFEPDTFRHVRTEYFYRTGQLTTPNPNRPGQIGGTSPSSYTVTEEFSNFKKADDLVLPLTYVLEYTSDAGRTLVWTINFSQVVNNQEIDASAFRVS